jgi:hypothetical protein
MTPEVTRVYMIPHWQGGRFGSLRRADGTKELNLRTGSKQVGEQDKQGRL